MHRTMHNALTEAWDLFKDDDTEQSSGPVTATEETASKCMRCGDNETHCRTRFIHHRNEAKGTTPLIELASIPHVGGGRGFKTRVALPPGVCVLAEVPVCVWPIDCEWNTPEGQRAAVRTIVQSSKAHVSAKTLHPRALEDTDDDSLRRIREVHGPFLDKLSKETAVVDDELLRLLLVLQHNGFSSGLYDYLSMFNHSCEPNCIKFSTTTSDAGVSEVWTTRHIAPGEELCISYCAPEAQLRSTIRGYLQDQHRFTCACPRCVSNVHATESYLVEGDAEETDKAAREFENSLGELEDELAADSLSASELYGKLVQLVSRAQQLMAPEHILWVRLYRLDADINVALLEDKEAGSKAASRFLQASLSALPILARYLGGYHPDLAAVHHDIAEGITGLLNQAPQELFQQFADVVGTTSATARAAANKHRSMKNRLAYMYEIHRHYPEINELADAGDYKYGCHIPTCTTPHIADATLYALIGHLPATPFVDSLGIDAAFLYLTVIDSLPKATTALVNNLNVEGATLWPGAFTGSQGRVAELRDQMNQFLDVAKESYNYDTDTFTFSKRKHDVTRLPRIGHGKHNIHFDAYGSEGHDILAAIAELGRFEEVLSAYQNAPCTLSEAGIGITRPRTGTDAGEGIEWHSDGGPGACTVLVCLEDVTPEQGSLGVVPRSHLQYEGGTEYDVANAGTTPLHYPYRAGVPMIIDARTVHRATDNVSNKWRAIFWFIFDTMGGETMY